MATVSLILLALQLLISQLRVCSGREGGGGELLVLLASEANRRQARKSSFHIGLQHLGRSFILSSFRVVTWHLAPKSVTNNLSV